ncbi:MULTISPECIES: YfbR-like 5'-deoxynucleotidase [Kosmotoga]|uniref:Hydrolase of HD superfamily-like protein n=1 Tax=Kosmotoga olearia (strain ATCC BAA-1733 / DSM 21960 / TBF 19.5.1) TaxID=521045 RepID=C5CGT8_KOSOT|nr:MULTISPECIES: YfbR-like 5'-deoxynucleotidase [Kosmotoga]ACR80607.1 hydrolase of HD superfamily-like protein [Kosmotoga olearia TBF 19.5.1]MDI3523262.1 hypothetical protein [Kosmotoga sp.]MDK2952808.1 hypothetical protein [Kosmotoga sp.]OAA19473.1 hydrolase [Kosmotoga sp. DU53]
MYQWIVKLLELSTNLFTMYRWNNLPTIMRTNEAQNAFISAQFSLLMSELANLGGEKINEQNLLKRILLKELPKCVLSDISVDTKVLIKEFAPEKWDAVFSTAVEEVVSILPEKTKKDFSETILNARDESPEGRIITVADLLSAKLEAEIHSRFFPEFYEEPLRRLKETLKEFNDFQPYKALVNSDWFENYRRALIVLLSAVRWNRLNRNVKTTVAGHSFYVAISGFLLAYTENQNGNSVDLVEVVKRTLFHDIPESVTGDIITPTKKKVPGFEEVISRVEEHMVNQRIFDSMDSELVKKLKPRILDPFAGKEGEMVRSADLLAAIVECLMEIETGNNQPAFRSALNSMLDQLAKSEFSSVRFVSEDFKWGLRWMGR